MSDFRSPAWLLGQGPAPADLRVSDAERQAVADQLSSAFGDGRLDQAEFDERLSQAMNAKTYRDLDGLLTDLPSTQASGGAGLPPGGGAGLTSRASGSVPQRRLARPVLMIVVAVVALSVAGHAAAWAFGGWLWIVVIALIVLAFARRSRRPDYHDTTK
jgi:hypothetical protein